jgi:hypothetical protein
MSEEPLQPARQPSQPQPQGEEEIRGSTWMVVQQVAQVVGEVGGGIGGIAGAVQVAKGMVGGSKSDGGSPDPPQGQTPSNDK